MALAKLWKAVFGSWTTAPQAHTEPTAATPVKSAAGARSEAATGVAVAKHASKNHSANALTSNASSIKLSTKVSSLATPSPGVPAVPVVKLSRKKTKPRREKPAEAQAVAVPQDVVPTLRMFRRKNNAWTKLIGSRTTHSILDLNVGNGAHAIDLLEAIVDGSTPPPKYIAIGMFELAGEKLTVREFHKKIRGVGGQLVVIPMSLAEGLRRVSQTIGTVDLVLLDTPDVQPVEPAVDRLLKRVMTGNTLVVRRDAAGRWSLVTSQLKKAS